MQTVSDQAYGGTRYALLLSFRGNLIYARAWIVWILRVGITILTIYLMDAGWASRLWMCLVSWWEWTVRSTLTLPSTVHSEVVAQDDARGRMPSKFWASLLPTWNESPQLTLCLRNPNDLLADWPSHNPDKDKQIGMTKKSWFSCLFSHRWKWCSSHIWLQVVAYFSSGNLVPSLFSANLNCLSNAVDICLLAYSSNDILGSH